MTHQLTIRLDLLLQDWIVSQTTSWCCQKKIARIVLNAGVSGNWMSEIMHSNAVVAKSICELTAIRFFTPSQHKRTERQCSNDVSIHETDEARSIKPKQESSIHMFQNPFMCFIAVLWSTTWGFPQKQEQ